MPWFDERPDDPLMPEFWFTPREDELLLDPPRLELLEPDDALKPSSRLLELEAFDDEPLLEALSPPWPERSCELPRPELVFPDEPRP